MKILAFFVLLMQIALIGRFVAIIAGLNGAPTPEIIGIYTALILLCVLGAIQNIRGLWK